MAISDFEIINELGSGSFGKVFKAKKKSDKQLYAIKQIDLGSQSQREKENAVNEIRLLASINSPYVIGFKDSFFDEYKKTLCIVMEFAQEGDLQKKIDAHIKSRTKFKEAEIWSVASDVLSGARFLHQNKILHRDIKAANIFFNGGVAKLGDMNVSRVLKEQNFAKTQTGTPYYTSPEIWQGKAYGPKCDIWSIGCVIYEMAALRPPFVAQTYEGLFRKVQLGMYERIEGYSPRLSSLIQKCLKVNERDRWTADQLLTCRELNFGNHSEELENSIVLLETIRVPKALKFLNDHLPEAQYQPKSKKTIGLDSENRDKGSLALIPEFEPKSLKNIKSQKFLPIIEREPSIERKQRPPAQRPDKPEIKPFEAMNANKLPKIESSKNLGSPEPRLRRYY